MVQIDNESKMRLMTVVLEAFRFRQDYRTPDKLYIFDSRTGLSSNLDDPSFLFRLLVRDDKRKKINDWSDYFSFKSLVTLSVVDEKELRTTFSRFGLDEYGNAFSRSSLHKKGYGPPEYVD
jgi:hypothetical protein